MSLYQFKEKHSEVIKTRSSSNILSVIKGITPAEMALFVEIMLIRARLLIWELCLSNCFDRAVKRTTSFFFMFCLVLPLFSFSLDCFRADACPSIVGFTLGMFASVLLLLLLLSVVSILVVS